MLVVGAKEQEGDAVAVRPRVGGHPGAMPVRSFIAHVRDEVAARV
jgi:threonyl-tRNA synthetase